MFGNYRFDWEGFASDIFLRMLCGRATLLEMLCECCKEWCPVAIALKASGIGLLILTSSEAVQDAAKEKTMRLEARGAILRCGVLLWTWSSTVCFEGLRDLCERNGVVWVMPWDGMIPTEVPRTRCSRDAVMTGWHGTMHHTWRLRLRIRNVMIQCWHGTWWMISGRQPRSLIQDTMHDAPCTAITGMLSLSAIIQGAMMF